MIVRPGPGGVHLITQPDHARLAGEVMAHVTALAGHPRRTDILLATAEHDCGWAEPDDVPTIDATGGVVDFVRASLEVRQDTSLRGIEMLASAPWAAALVAQHRLVVYDRFRGQAEWRDYFARAEAMRAQHLKASGGSLHDLEADYRYVRLGDLISLTFCTGWTSEERYLDDVVRFDGERVLVIPDIFGGVTVPMTIEAAAVTPPFAADTELHRAIAAAKRVTLRSSVTGG